VSRAKFCRYGRRSAGTSPEVWPIRHQTCPFEVGSGPVHRRQSFAQRRGVDLNPVGVDECGVGTDIESVRATPERLKGLRDILRRRISKVATSRPSVLAAPRTSAISNTVK
jgi:hypothetical protein